MNFKSWIQYFENNQSHFTNMNWQSEDHLNDPEREIISSSIQQFQKGENSEGKHLFAYAKKFPEPGYLDCIKLFIKEEQMHARILGRFMDMNNIPRIRHHWVDSIFRLLRKLNGLENTIIVLVTAEIIAKIYYQALMKATSSLILKQICHQILRDEAEHISFQCCALRNMFEKKKIVGKFISRSWHLSLMLLTILVVWLHHRKVLKNGGYYFSKFFLETLLVFFNADEMVKQKAFIPKVYQIVA